jgi:hypothetical protein
MKDLFTSKQVKSVFFNPKGPIYITITTNPKEKEVIISDISISSETKQVTNTSCNQERKTPKSNPATNRNKTQLRLRIVELESTNELGDMLVLTLWRICHFRLLDRCLCLRFLGRL